MKSFCDIPSHKPNPRKKHKHATLSVLHLTCYGLYLLLIIHRQVAACSDGQVKIYELLDTLELEKWQLQVFICRSLSCIWCRKLLSGMLHFFLTFTFANGAFLTIYNDNK